MMPARRLLLESLEDRRLLAANPGVSLDLSLLQIVPDDYEASSFIVRYHTDTLTRDEGADTYGPSRVVGSKALGDGLKKIELAPGVALQSMLQLYQSDPQVVYAEPDYRVRIALLPNDARIGEQWALHNTGQTGGIVDADIDAPEAWTVATGTGSTIVAVIDTGVDYRHPDLAANMWNNVDEIPGDGIDNDNNGYVDDVHGYDFFNNDGDPLDDHNHGTHVAGTIGAKGNDGIGIAGVNWNLQIMALKFLGSDGSGTTSAAIEAIRYAIDNGAHISNNSWGGDPYSQAMFDAIAEARDANHIFVAASGNGDFIGFGIDNDAQPFYPAGYNLDNIVAVAATDHRDGKAIFSNYGLTSVDIGAPGVDILSTTKNGTYGLSSGTSMATPHVTGALSLVRDVAPGLSYQQVIDRVLLSAEPIDSLQGITVTGGRLNLAAAIIPDTVGPKLASVQPSGLILDPFDTVTIRFDEPIDGATFTPDDILSFAGPDGTVGPLTLSPVAGSSNREFTLTFPSQSTAGNYQLVLSPEIRDRFGNAIDGNDNGVGGELPGDELTHHFVKADALARFDFGTSTSAVAEHYTRVVGGNRYDAAVGYGWAQGAVYSLSRDGDPLTGDFNYTVDATFAVGVPNGEYDVIVTMGETIVPHDQMGVFLEGVQVDSVTTAAGQFAVNTYRASVSDGQLSLGLRDLGGSDVWVMLNALDVVFAGPDLTGPRILSTDAEGIRSGPIDRIHVSFSEPLQDGSFTVDDVLSLIGPDGPITPLSVELTSDGSHAITFEQVNASGDFSLVLGSDIADVAGNLLDQDSDGVGGESPDDHFEASFTLEKGPEFLAGYDFGTSTSPVADGYIQVTTSMRYDESVGFGWSSGSVYSLSRGGEPLTQDVNYTRDAVFSVDLPNGEYDVAVTLGEALIAHNLMGVFLEGVHVDTVDTAAYQFVKSSHRISISDGQLNLGLKDLGGSDVWVMVNALDILYVGPDLSGPSVTSSVPDGATTGPIDRVTVTFNEPIDAASFTLDDIVSLDGPNGAIVPISVNQFAPGQFEIAFDPQNEGGSYVLVLAPSISDIAGNFMDQDGDGIAGESSDDQFVLTFTVEPGPELVALIDFGTTLSPIAEGYTRITSSDRYSASVGYGWQTGSVYSLNRGGDALTRDLNYTADATFAFDLPNGQYEVTVIQGEALISHDLMAIHLEGIQVDTVSTAAYQFLTNTYTAEVTDGQLTLRLRDTGGSNVWAVINGLQIARSIGSQSASNAMAVLPLSGGDQSIADDDSAADASVEVNHTPKAKVKGVGAFAVDPARVDVHDEVMALLGRSQNADSDNAADEEPGVALALRGS
jgi:subtilisin family serine protease/fibronectin type 3 domain-containing protein